MTTPRLYRRILPAGPLPLDLPGQSPSQLSIVEDPKLITDNDVEAFQKGKGKVFDPELPVATIARIMRRSVPSEVRLTEQCVHCVQQCASEFILFIAGEANAQTRAASRRTIQGEDVMRSMQTLGFDRYAQLTQIYLERYRQKALNRVLLKGGKLSSGHRNAMETAAVISALTNLIQAQPPSVTTQTVTESLNSINPEAPTPSQVDLLTLLQSEDLDLSNFDLSSFQSLP